MLSTRGSFLLSLYGVSCALSSSLTPSLLSRTLASSGNGRSSNSAICQKDEGFSSLAPNITVSYPVPGLQLPENSPLGQGSITWNLTAAFSATNDASTLEGVNNNYYVSFANNFTNVSSVDQFAACIVVFETSSKEIPPNVTAHDGDCTSVFDAQCVSDLRKQFTSAPTTGQGIGSPDPCDAAFQSSNALPPSCNQWSWLYSGRGSTSK